MKTHFLAFTTLVVVATFVSCAKESTTATSDTKASVTTATTETVATTATTATTESTAVTDTTTTVTTKAPNGAEQIKEGAKQVGKGLKEEARQAATVAGAALERGGVKLQEKAAEAAPQKTEVATQTAPAPAAQPLAQPPAQASAAGNAANGASLFKGKCIACHGADASSNTTIGTKNHIPDLRSAAVQGLTDAQLAALIANGKAGGLSASAHKSKALTQDQIADAIAYLRSIRQ